LGVVTEKTKLRLSVIGAGSKTNAGLEHRGALPAKRERYLLSVLMPLFNEEEFVAASIQRVLDAPLPEGMDLELVVVDDGSTDSSVEIVEELVQQHPGKIWLTRHPVNRGKGAAIRTAIQLARGEFAIIHDADLEYDPQEFPKLLQPLLDGNADAVYGSRFQSAGERRVLYFWHALANRVLTTLCNIASDLNLTDMETCYKAFRTDLVKTIPLRSERFGIEPEITMKLAQRQVRIYEVPIRYHGRTYDEGKKIGLRDAIQAVFIILRYWISKDTYLDPGAQILDTLAHTPRFNHWMAETIRPFVGSRVLELGAGIGNLTRQLSPRRKRYVASDIDAEHLARLRNRFQNRPNLQIEHCDLTNPEDFVPFAQQMDTVICLNVVEHVGDDQLALSNIASTLAEGGRAIVLVPQGQSIYGTLDEVLGHYRRYSEADLRNKMEQAGMRLEKMIRFNRVTRPAWFINGRIFKKRTFGRFQLWVFDRMVWLWRRIDSLLPWNPVSIIAIGVKRGE
jgi:glycosyltransferase involved in cell wall biosynthesis/ubiquinone/menaquinone biosynthesis C-methylase UbiE